MPMDRVQRQEFLETFSSPEYGYTKVDGYDTLFSINGEMVNIEKSFGIVYSQDEQFKTLHKHGDYEKIKELFETKYKPLAEVFNFKILEVPVEKYLWINVIINISASTWIDQLIAELDIFDVEVIEKK